MKDDELSPRDSLILDYVTGGATPEQHADLEHRMSRNPDLAAEVRDYQRILNESLELELADRGTPSSDETWGRLAPHLRGGHRPWSHVFAYAWAAAAVLVVAFLVLERTSLGVGSFEFDWSPDRGFHRRNVDPFAFLSGARDGPIVFVHGSQGWVDSGYDIAPGAEVRVTASGGVICSADGWIDSVRADMKAQLPWIDPEGHPWPETELGRMVRPFAILPDAPQGALLACLVAPTMAECPWRPESVTTIGASGLVRNGGMATKRLWLCVNDVVLDNSEAAKAAFIEAKRYDQSLRSSNDPPDRWKDYAAARWSNIVEAGFFDIWFQDNLGSFLVVVGGE
ncbi:MAG: hypothetical protein KDE27_01025 [Planctomycetes bacterium]|nr:hypothetical protein [Planctomycetota bacterium]